MTESRVKNLSFFRSYSVVTFFRTIFRRSGALCALMLSLVSAPASQALAQDATDVADWLRYCVEAIAADDPSSPALPRGAELGEASALISGSDENGFVLSEIRGDWVCNVSHDDADVMGAAGRALFAGLPGADLAEATNRAGAPRLMGGACVGDARVTIMINGPMSDAWGAGTASISGAYGDLVAC